MRKPGLVLTSLLISSLLALQAMADTVGAAEAAYKPQSSPVITTGAGREAPAAALSTVTSVPSTVYQPGTYQIGADIPPGEYVLLTPTPHASGYYAIYADSSESAEPVDYNLFDYNAIIQVEDGQALQLRDCTASPIEEVSQIDHYYGSMYKVGYHIPAGTYRLKATDSTSYGIAYILSAPNDNYDAVVDYVYVEDTAAITVSAGQYLQLSSCVVTAQAPASEATPNHGMPDTSWADTLRTELLGGDAQRTSPIVTAGTLIPGLPTATSSPSTVYSENLYQAGADIPAGEYVLFKKSDDAISVYMISSTPSPESLDEVISYGVLQYNAIINLEEGQYLAMSDCNASPLEEVPSIDYRQGNHFKVGYHIPPGTYQFKSNSLYGAAYSLSTPSLNNEDVINYAFAYGTDSVVSLTLKEGQYLYLVKCSFTSEATRQSGPGGSGTDALSSTLDTYIEQLKQLLGYEEEDTPSPVVTAPTRARTLPAATSTPSTVYADGTYQAGVDIPAGEYMLLAKSSSSDNYFGSSNVSYVISRTENPAVFEEIIDYDDFSYNAIIRIEEGQYLSINGCNASPIEEVPQLDSRKAEMYKAGLHIPAGTYRLIPKASSYGGSYLGRCYLLSYPSDTADAVIETIRVAEDGAVVTVADGQYLQLKSCTLTDIQDSDTSKTGPAFAAPSETEAEHAS